MNSTFKRLSRITAFFLFILCGKATSEEILHHPIVLKYAHYHGGEASFTTTFENPQLSVDSVGYFNFFGYLANETSLPERVAPYTWKTRVGAPGLPAFDEEYFEWIDLLEAIDQASDRFVMIEIGANYGRWSGRAAAAAKIKNIPVFLGIVEAIRSRWKFIKENMEYNSVEAYDFKVFPCAVGNEESQVVFYISNPGRNEFITNWRGQSALVNPRPEPRPIDQFHEGFQVYQTKNNYHVVKVEQKPLSSIIKEIPYDVIDLCDFDIQGAEFNAIEEAIDVMNQRVKCLHIGTHGLDIEANLKKLLLSNQWTSVRDFPNQTLNDTEYGKIQFVDGV